MEVENKIDFSSDDEELMKFANMVDEACEQEDQIELSPDEEEYDSDSVPLASYLNWVAKHRTRPEPQETEVNEIATSPLHYTTLSMPTVCVEQATAETEVQSEPQPQNKDIDKNVNDSTEPGHISHVKNSPADTACRENAGDIIITEVDKREPQGRKRRKEKCEWNDSVRKEKRNRGEEYVGKRGNKVERRRMKDGCGRGCRYKCHINFNEQKREGIFHGFWELSDTQRQWDFLATHVTEFEAKRTSNAEKSSSRRQKSKKWTLPLDVNNVAVCKTFFLDTLNISEARVITAIKKKVSGINFTSGDMRGRHHMRPTKNSIERDAVKAHIESFPTVESHYCRHSTQRRYLEADLSLQMMHRLYAEGRPNALSLTSYKTIFYSEYNIGFHKPKKDVCDFCSTHLQATKVDPNTNQEAYLQHRKDIDTIRQYKESIKRRVRQTNDEAGATFDLEEVLPTPKSNESCLYYKRKLNTYNLTVFDFDKIQARNFVWNERQAKRGSNEIASCVYKYLLNKAAEGKRKVYLFSDSCSGQNRNKNFLAMLAYVVQTSPIEKIEHNFFVRGHSENESDSVHSCISRASKHLQVYTTPQWAATIRNAKKVPPKYLVHEMSMNDFLDFSKISDAFKNVNTDTYNDKINWLHMKRYSVRKSEPLSFHAYLEYEEEPRTIHFGQGSRRKNQDLDISAISLEKAYSKPLLINSLKLADLKSLCDSNIIPPVHHAFFKNLE